MNMARNSATGPRKCGGNSINGCRASMGVGSELEEIAALRPRANARAAGTARWPPAPKVPAVLPGSAVTAGVLGCRQLLCLCGDVGAFEACGHDLFIRLGHW